MDYSNFKKETELHIRDKSISTKQTKKRFMWLDIAKSIAIFLMIEGHLAPYAGTVRNFIYSFHMPLFFIATGFTAHKVTTRKELFILLKRDLLRIYIPCLLFQLINGLLSFFIYHENAIASLRLRLDQVFWASAFDVNGHSCLGICWFLIALFWSKTIFNLIQLLFPSRYNGAIYLSFALIGKALASSQIYLPQNLDVCFMVIFFIYIGFIFRQIYPTFKQYQLLITCIAFGIWAYLVDHGIWIDVGGRMYPDLIPDILGAICGTIFIFSLSEALESCSVLAKFLAFIGRNTMIIFFVSFIDWIGISLWARGYYYSYVARPVFVLALIIIIVKTDLTKATYQFKNN